MYVYTHIRIYTHIHNLNIFDSYHSTGLPKDFYLLYSQQHCNENAQFSVCLQTLKLIYQFQVCGGFFSFADLVGNYIYCFIFPISEYWRENFCLLVKQKLYHSLASYIARYDPDITYSGNIVISFTFHIFYQCLSIKEFR